MDLLGYKLASATQAGAGTTAILAAPAAGHHYEVVWYAIEISVVGAGTWSIQAATGPVVLAAGTTIALLANNMPCGCFNVPAGDALNLVVGTAGTVTVHVLYKLLGF